MDHFIHGLMLDMPDQRTIVVFGLPVESITVLDGNDQPLVDPDLMSVSGGVAVYILPVDATYTLHVTAESVFDLGVYQAADGNGGRETFRHSLQPDEETAASMSISSDSDYTLDLDEDGDGMPDRNLQATTLTVDMVKPTISISHPSPESTLSGSEVTLQFEFSDNAGGSGINPSSVRIRLDNKDLTSQASITPDSLTCEVANLTEGEHTVQVEVSDIEGNKTISEWHFILEDGLLSTFGDPLLLVVGGGAAFLLLGLGGLIVILALRRRSRSEPALAPAQYPMTQDEQGRWWSQDPVSGSWFLWDGATWQPHGAPGVVSVQSGVSAPRHSGSCLLVLGILSLLTILVVGSVFVIRQGFIPGLTLPQVGTFNLQDLLKTAGFGLLLTVIGTLSLKGGLKAIRERRAKVDYGDEDFTDIREVSGFRAVMHGIGQVGIGLGFLLAGLVLAALAISQQILPWLGF
jgi:hypothetical protein